MTAASDVQTLIDNAQAQTAKRIEAVETGRDRLLEIASFDRSRGEMLASSMTDSDEDPDLADYMEQVFDMYGVESEDDTDTLILHQGARMEVDDFPGIPEEGITGTWKRALALAKEDHAFLSCEHPIAFEAMDLVLRGDRGRTCMVALPVNVLPSGTVLVEALFILEVVAPGFAAFRRFMPELSVRNLVGTRPDGTHWFPRLAGAISGSRFAQRKNDLESASRRPSAADRSVYGTRCEKARERS